MSFSDLLYLLPVCLIAIFAIGLFWLAFAYSMFRSIDRNMRRCPSCKRGATGRITDTDIEALGIQVDRSRLTTIHEKREKVTDHYQCERCDHTWTFSFERKEILPTPENT